MDITTIIGLILGAGAVIGGQVLEGGSVHSIMQATAAIIVLGGTFGAVLVSFPLENILGALKGIGDVFRGPHHDLPEIIKKLVNLANKARKEGILSLEKDVRETEDPFLKKSLRLAVDGIEPNAIRETMEKEIEQIEEAGNTNAKVFESAGGFSPTIGIIGAVLGLIHVMENLSDPSKLGGGIACAFVATVYGVASANLLFIPVGAKLKLKHHHEILVKEMILEGVICISLGENTRLLEEKLKSFLSEAEKKKAGSNDE